jgi:D-alanyl-D-alanine carboxypeptidase (penicillin-binding protein 5/6)
MQSNSLLAIMSAGSRSTRALCAALVMLAAAAFTPRSWQSVAAAVAPPPPNAAEPKAWIVVDADTGRVLAGRDVHTAYPPASISKVMTALTALERLPPSATVTITPEAEAKGQTNLTATGMKAGEHWPLDLTIGLLLVVSANDAAYSLATTTSGSLANFAAAEAATAKQLGMHDSTFADPAGLDDGSSFGGGPRMSAFDVAQSTRVALHIPQLAKWPATVQFSYTDRAGAHHTVANHNKLLLPGIKHYDGTTGFKTGFTRLAGDTLIATATRGGRTMIAVVMNTYDTYGWAAQLLDRGFAMPVDAVGTGERMPTATVSTYAQRAGDRAAFLALAQGTLGGLTAATTLPDVNSVTTYHTTTTSATAQSTSAPRRHHRRAPTAKSAGAAGSTGASAANSGSGGTSWVLIFEIVAIGVVVAGSAILLRRRAVRRRRSKRLAQRRQMQAALRRGSLPVVDGRYRPGMRTGKPVASHVTIHRGPDEGSS